METAVMKHNETIVRLNESISIVSTLKDINLFRTHITKFKEPIVEEKIEGVCAEVSYNEEGQLERIILKGANQFGFDITHKHKLIKHIPLALSHHGGETTIVGIVTCFKHDYHRYCEYHKKEANELKGVISTKLKCDKNTNKKSCFSFHDISFTFVALHATTETRNGFYQYSRLQELLVNNGFNVPKRIDNIETRLPDSVYPIEGYVGKDGHLSKWKTTTDSVFDSFIAYNTPVTILPVTVLNAIWGINSFRSLTCTLNTQFGPTSTHRFYSVKSLHGFADKGIRTNDVVEVLLENKRDITLGDVIQLNQGNKIIAPKVCPYCSMKLQTDNQITLCINQDCISQIKNKLKRMAEPDGLNLLYLTDEVIDSLIETEDVIFRDDIFALPADVIAPCKDLPISHWLYAANIPNLNKARCLALEELLVYCVRPLNTDGLLEFLSDLHCTMDCFDSDGIAIVSYVVANYEELYRFFTHYSWNNVICHRSHITNIAYTGNIDSDIEELKILYKERNCFLSSTLTKNSAYLLVGSNPLPHILDLADSYDVKLIYTNPRDFILEQPTGV